MTAPAELSSALDGYQLHLPTYEGPLDVLLRLIERNRLPVTDVSLVAVTDQFLAYVAGLDHVSADLLAEFTTTAARLLALKSRALLPRPPAAEQPEQDAEDLATQLRAYQFAGDGASWLEACQDAGRQSWAREVPSLAMPMPLPAQESPLALRRALGKCARRGPQPVRTVERTPRITLAAMTRRLLARLGNRRRARFADLLGPAPARAERVVGFIALLSLVRQRVLMATQDAPFGEIEVERSAVPAGTGDD